MSDSEAIGKRGERDFTASHRTSDCGPRRKQGMIREHSPAPSLPLRALIRLGQP